MTVAWIPSAQELIPTLTRDPLPAQSAAVDLDVWLYPVECRLVDHQPIMLVLPGYDQ